MEKHKGYQRILEEGEDLTRNRLMFKVSSKYPFLERRYWEISRLSLYGIKKIPNINVALKILDIGCGTGIAINYIKRFLNPDAEFFGVDLRENKELPNYVNFSICDIDKNNLPYNDSCMDIVVSTFVLEHLHNPENLFSEAYRVLKPSGYFYCVTEYYTGIFNPDKYDFYADPTHIRPLEYFGIIPFIPILNLLKIANIIVH